MFERLTHRGAAALRSGFPVVRAPHFKVEAWRPVAPEDIPREYRSVTEELQVQERAATAAAAAAAAAAADALAEQNKIGVEAKAERMKAWKAECQRERERYRRVRKEADRKAKLLGTAKKSLAEWRARPHQNWACTKNSVARWAVKVEERAAAAAAAAAAEAEAAGRLVAFAARNMGTIGLGLGFG